MSSREPDATSGQVLGRLPTAAATFGEFTKSLRIGGTVETLRYAAIKVPKLRGPGNADRAPFTLATLAEPGIVIPAGSVVAEFESRLAAKARARKAELDVSTAAVRSKIEGEILRNVAHEARAIWQQKERERQFMEIVYGVDLRKEQLTVRKAELHVERHLHDLERLQVETTIAGMVVLEATYKAGSGGLYAQTKNGDRLSPGSLFMRIVDVSEMIVNASLNQVDALTIGIGDKTVIELDAYPGERFEGRVVELGAVAGAAKYSRGGRGSFLKQIPARILIESKDDRILPGLSASVDVVYSRPQSGVLVPREAIQSEPGTDGNSFVHIVAGDGTYHKRPIRVQDFNDTEALVSAGWIPERKCFSPPCQEIATTPSRIGLSRCSQPAARPHDVRNFGEFQLISAAVRSSSDRRPAGAADPFHAAADPPQAIGSDGFRWHVRACCEQTGQFKDFLVARIIETRGTRGSGSDPHLDRDWHEYTEIVIGPNPGLSDSQRQVVALDYGMQGDRVTLHVRRALLLLHAQAAGPWRGRLWEVSRAAAYRPVE